MFVARRAQKKPTQRRLNRSREVGLIVLICAALFMAFFLVFGDSGYLELRKKEHQLHQLELVRDSHAEDNRQIQADIEKLKNNLDRIEKIAREELKLSKQGEIIVQLRDPEPQGKETHR